MAGLALHNKVGVCRPAIVAGMQLVVEDESELRNSWKLHHDLDLPAQVRSPIHCYICTACLHQQFCVAISN